MANAVTLKDKNGVECYPKTHVKQIVGSNGKTQETVNSEINEKLTELGEDKLSKDELAQATGSSTTIPMSQDAVTKILAGLLPNQRADNTPYISVAINDGDSGQNWETFNRKLDEVASMSDPMPYNGDVKYFISEGLRVDVTNRIFDSSEGATRRLTQVVTGNIRLDDRLDLALNGDADQSFWRIYKEGAWSEWKAVNAGGGSGSVDVVQVTGSSMTAVMSQNAVTNEFKKRDNLYFTTLDVVSIDDGANVSAEEFDEIIRIQDAIKNQKTIISSIGILASSVVYRRPLYTVSISYIIGNELRMITAKTPLNGGGTWSVKSQDLSNLANNGYNVLIHGDYAHGEGVSSKLAYEGSTIPSDVQQVMMEWYMSSTGYAIAYGPGSHVEGQDCLATGNYAHAEGIKTLAANNGAHAEGTGTNAAGTYAHAEGQSTTAYATACHAEGGMCICNGNYGHVEGFRTQVENTAGHAEGYITYCRANYGHVEGRQTNSIGPCAHAEGYGNKIDRSITITSISNIEGHTSYFQADNISDLKVGACFIIDYIPYVVTDIADGNIYVNRWIEFKQQKYDIIIMYGAAYGNNAHTEGELGSAIGNNSHVSGMSCIAFNDNEVACGHYNFSFWSNDNAKRTLYSIGIGESDSNRKNAYELKENGDLYIYGVGGYTGKNSSEAKTIQKVITEQQQGGSGGGIEDAPKNGKTYGRKDGAWTKAVGQIDSASNGTGEIFNDYAGNVASGKFSHAEGRYSHAIGDYSRAEGHYSYANGEGSYARNPYAKANGKYSHSEGLSTVADNYAQFSIGVGNIKDELPSANSFDTEKVGFVIGNGSWPGLGYYASSRGDAFRVFFNGKVESDMNYSTPAADYAEMFEWKDGNISNEDRVGLFVTLEGENISLANAESKYILGVVSAVPAVLGDSPIQWHGKYLNDEWGRLIYEDVEYTEVKDVIKEDGSIEKVKEKKTAHVRKINPDYDGDMEYKPRAERQEWDAIGMLGKLMVKHDGTLVKGGFCKPSAGGIATKSESGYYVMKVINDYQALILFR